MRTIPWRCPCRATISCGIWIIRKSTRPRCSAGENAARRAPELHVEGAVMADEVQSKIAAVWNSMDTSWESYGKILEDKARANAGKVAVRTAHDQITYAQLEARVNQVGNVLAALGVTKGDKVCVMLPNIPEFLYVWWG